MMLETAQARQVEREVRVPLADAPGAD